MGSLFTPGLPGARTFFLITCLARSRKVVSSIVSSFMLGDDVIDGGRAFI